MTDDGSRFFNAILYPFSPLPWTGSRVKSSQYTFNTSNLTLTIPPQA